MRQIRQRQQQRVAPLFHLGQRDLVLLDLLGAGLVLCEDAARIAALFLGARDRFTRRVLFPLQILDERDQSPPLRLERGEGRQIGGRIETARTQPRRHILCVISHVPGIEHGSCYPACDRMRSHGVDALSAPVRKAVFPAAGLGTRFLPATKAQPKEMLPLVDKPIIQYGVEEATAAGIQDIVIVTGRGKNAIEDHFDVAIELESFLESRGKRDLAQEIRGITNLVRSVSYVRQGEPLGLGHAVLTAQPLVGQEPFAVILADDVIDATPSALAQMLDVYNEVDGPVILVERIPRAEISGYGVIAYEPVRKGVYRITDLVEKPAPADAPSELAIIGRYILTPDIFDMLVAESADTRTGEIQLTNGLKRLLAKRPLYACEVTGVRHDTGNKLGFLKAVVYFALRRPDLAGPFREYLESL